MKTAKILHYEISLDEQGLWILDTNQIGSFPTLVPKELVKPLADQLMAWDLRDSGFGFEEWVESEYKNLEQKFLKTSDGKQLLDDALSDLGDNPLFQEFCRAEWEALNA